jgi:signal transduction histidine kinase
VGGKVKLGLRIKFFLYSNTLIVVTMTLVTVFALVHERKTRYEAIDRRGRSIADVLAIPARHALEEGGKSTGQGAEQIEEQIAQVLSQNRDLMRYVVVTDAGGRISHTNETSRLGKDFDRALSPGAIREAPDTAILIGEDDEKILEVVRPLDLAGGFGGTLAVGFSLEPIERQVATLAKRAALVAIVLMIGNSALTAIYVETLIRPLLGLHQIIRRATRGDLTVRATKASAEVGELADAFNRMMDELEEAREREKVQQQQLAHTEKMAAVGTLAAGVAHEVNNPLGGVLTCIENLRADPGDRENLVRYLDLIQDGIKRIERTVANLLDFSRQRRLVLEPTSINHNLRHVLELVEYQLRQAQIEVVLQLDSDEPYVMADHFQMEQLFLNLVLNALQAMPDGGTLTLQSRAREGRVTVEVRDTGTGISDEIRERIFDPFFTTREVDEGTGLGLAVSDSIVSSHGGALEVESSEGKGSVFRVSFAVLGRLEGGEGA